MTHQHLLRLARTSLLALAPALAAVNSDATIVRFTTVLGNVDVRLYDSATPITTANFLNYANTNRYDGSFIHRSVPGFVIQGGGFTYNATNNTAPGIVTDPPILNEYGISNLRGTMAMAKLGSGPNTATSQWFFNLADNSANLNNQNGGFTVFARVVGAGMSVVDAIAALPRADLDGASGTTFDTVPLRTGTSLADRLVFMTDVSVLNLAPGDYDRDGDVDLTDYGVWQSTYGSTTVADADGNGDGVVNSADYSVWRDSFAAAATAVPEPTSAAAALAAMAPLAVRTTRRRHNATGRDR